MVNCCVPSCKSKQGSAHSLGLRFHQIPAAEELREKWLAVISRKGPDGSQWVPSDYAHVCSLHFKEEDYRIDCKRKILKPGVVPSKCPGYPVHRQPTNKTPPIVRAGRPTFSNCTQSNENAKSPLIYTQDMETVVKSEYNYVEIKDPIRVDLVNESIDNNESITNVPTNKTPPIVRAGRPTFSNCTQSNENAKSPLIYTQEMETVVKSEYNYVEIKDPIHRVDLVNESIDNNESITNVPTNKTPPIVRAGRPTFSNCTQSNENAKSPLIYTQEMETVVKSEYNYVEIKDPIHRVDLVNESIDNESITNVKTEPSDFTFCAINAANVKWEDAREILQIEQNNTGACTSTQADENLVSADEFDKALPLKVQQDLQSGDTSFFCDTCGKEFSKKSYLAKHMEIHMGNMPFSCEICLKAFSRKDHLKTHYRLHTGDKPFSCAICGKSFSRGSSLKIHEVIHTGDRSYFCDICGKAFAVRSTLRKHILVHLGDKPFSCDLCVKSFSQSSNFKKHRLTHRDDTFSCTACGKKFKRNHNLQKHFLIHAGKQEFSLNT